MDSGYSVDNSGNRCGDGAIAVDPVAASGIRLSSGTPAGSDQTQTVEQGATYAITVEMDGGTFLFSITGVTSTVANIEWVGIEGTTIIVHIPLGSTTLYYESDTASKFAYMRKLAD